MRKNLPQLIYLLILFFLQTGALIVFSDRIHIVPQLTLLFILVAAFNLSYVQMLWLSFIAGSLLEFTSGLFFGTYIAGFVLIAVLNFLLTRKLTTREASSLSMVVLVLASTLAFTIWAFLYNGSLSLLDLINNSGPTNFFSFGMIGTFILNLIFFYPVLWGFKLLPKHPEREGGVLSR